MEIKVEFESTKEEMELIEQYRTDGYFLIKKEYLFTGKFLTFSTDGRANNLRDDIDNLMLAIAEMAEADVIEKTEMQLAIAELAEVIANG